jgi:hypothetical protein
MDRLRRRLGRDWPRGSSVPASNRIWNVPPPEPVSLREPAPYRLRRSRKTFWTLSTLGATTARQ